MKVAGLTHWVQPCKIDSSYGRRWLRPTDTAKKTNQAGGWKTRSHCFEMSSSRLLPRLKHSAKKTEARLNRLVRFASIPSLAFSNHLPTANHSFTRQIHKKSHRKKGGFSFVFNRLCNARSVEQNSVHMHQMPFKSLQLDVYKATADEGSKWLAYMPKMLYRRPDFEAGKSQFAVVLCRICGKQKNNGFPAVMQGKINFSAVKNILTSLLNRLFSSFNGFSELCTGFKVFCRSFRHNRIGSAHRQWVICHDKSPLGCGSNDMDLANRIA